VSYIVIVVVCSFIGAAIGLVVQLRRPSTPCPLCSEPLPKFIKSSERTKAGVPLGGTQCASCKTVIDAGGRTVA